MPYEFPQNLVHGSVNTYSDFLAALLIMMSSAGSLPVERSVTREANTGTTGTTTSDTE